MLARVGPPLSAPALPALCQRGVHDTRVLPRVHAWPLSSRPLARGSDRHNSGPLCREHHGRSEPSSSRAAEPSRCDRVAAGRMRVVTAASPEDQDAEPGPCSSRGSTACSRKKYEKSNQCRTPESQPSFRPTSAAVATCWGEWNVNQDSALLPRR